MQELLSGIQIQICGKVYLKDPQSSELGKKIIAHSIDMIEELGFDQFTFRKLSKELSTSEASIYRYFESKHKLLSYLTAWYWNWLELRLLFLFANISSPTERLRRAISLFTEQVEDEASTTHVNEQKLHRIVIAESSKVYLTKDVDMDNSEGFYAGYAQLVDRVSAVIKEINPDYKYPHMLVSTVIEGAHYQRYFAAHIPHLTDQLRDEDSTASFFTDLVFNAIKFKL